MVLKRLFSVLCVLIFTSAGVVSAQSEAKVTTITKESDKLLVKIPVKDLGREFLVVNRVVTAVINSGYYPDQQVGQDVVVSFRKGKDKVEVYVCNYEVRGSDSSEEMSKLLDRSQLQVPGFSCDIVEQSQQSVVFDATELFKRGAPFISAGASKIDACKFWNDGFSVTATRKLSSPTNGTKGDGGDMSVTTTLFSLRQTPYAARKHDSRVGYDMISYMSYEHDNKGPNTTKLIKRWPLVPKDEKSYMAGQLTDPIAPIVFYLDPAIPSKWKPYFVRAVEQWQQAFEAAGFSNAILAKELPKGDDVASAKAIIMYQLTNDKSPVKLNIDPRSGEIIQSHVNWSQRNINQLKYSCFAHLGTHSAKADLMTFDDGLLGELICVDVSRKVGQALGLLPADVASAEINEANLRDRNWLAANAMSPSILGSVTFNHVAQPDDKANVIDLLPKIGNYDRNAINFGYRYNTQPDVNYCIVANTDCRRTFLGMSPVKVAEYAINNIKGLMSRSSSSPELKEALNHVLANNVDNSEDFINQMLTEALEQIGGLSGTPTKVVDKQTQQDLVAFLNREIFTTPLWLLNSELLRSAGKYPVDVISMLQQKILKFIFEKGIARTYASRAYAPVTELYTEQNLLEDIHNGIWSEVIDHKPIDFFRRRLQANYITSLVGFSKTASSGYTTSLVADYRDKLTTLIEKSLPYYKDTEDVIYLKYYLTQLKK